MSYLDTLLDVMSKAISGINDEWMQWGTPLPSRWFGRTYGEMPAEDYLRPYSGGPRETTEVTTSTRVPAQPAVVPTRWMSRYDNGYIPLKAMTPIPGGGYLRPDVAAAFLDMYKAAKADGVGLYVGSDGAAYRTFQQQQDRAEEAGLYSQGGLAAVPGTSLHGWGLAVDVSGTGSATWLAQHADEFGFETIAREPWHWQWTGGYTPAQGTVPKQTETKPQAKQLPPYMAMAYRQPNYMFDAMFSLYADEAAVTRGYRPPRQAATGGNIKRQLWQGFMDAGREDLAKMVYTRDFDTWIRAEGSCWDPTTVSKYFPNHGRNAGLFQFALLDRDWVWEDVTHRGGEWIYGASAYEQAKYACRYFNLTPDDIRRYAAQVRAGTYHGWG